jgi:hypothetical protein
MISAPLAGIPDKSASRLLILAARAAARLVLPLAVGPNMVQAEIEQQLKPMTEQIIKRMSSVEQYQQKLAELIQQISSRL